VLESILNVAFSSLLTTISMPGYLYGGLIFFSLIPLFFALEKKGPFSAAILSFLYFFIFSFANFHYLINTLTKGMPELFGRFSSVTGILVFILFCVLEALPFLLFGFLYGLWNEKIRFRILEPIFVASVYVISEYLRSLGDLGFTGGRLSDALYSFKGLIQITQITGTLGLVLIIVIFNYEAYKLLKKNKYGISIVLAAFAIIILVNGIIDSKLPITIGEKPVVLAQTNVPQNVKYTYPSSTILEYLNEKFSDSPDFLTVFPEAVFPGEDIRRNKEVEEKLIQSFKNRTIVIGYPTFEGNAVFNSLNIYTKGVYVDKYDKIKLFPFVEMLPYKSIFGHFEFLKGMYYFTPGTLKQIKIDGYGNVGFLICFESYFSSLTRKVAKDSDFIIVSTNDGWYKSKIALIQHYTQTIFRAVENGRYVVQVSNTGISGVADYYGNFQILPDGTVWKVLYVKTNNKTTFYTKYGDYIVIIALFFMIFSGLSSKRKSSIFD